MPGFAAWTGEAIKCEVTLIIKIKDTDFVDYTAFATGYEWGGIIIDMQAPDSSGYRLIHEICVVDCANAVTSVNARPLHFNTAGQELTNLGLPFGAFRYELDYEMYHPALSTSIEYTVADMWWKDQPEFVA